MTRRWQNWLAFGGVVVASLGASKMAVDQSADQLRAAQQQARVQLTAASRKGCERTRLDRLAQVHAYRTAARSLYARADSPQNNSDERRTAKAAADAYMSTAAGFQSRIVDCAKAFPIPGVTP